MSAPRSTATPLDETRLASLVTHVEGAVVGPDDDGYDEARAVWNGSIDRHPAAILRCAGSADVVQGLAFARQHDLDVAIRGGAHNVAGFGTCDDGLVLDMSGMKAIDVDVAARTVTAGPGVLGRELDAATQAHGLATTTGVMSTTGIAGLTLGGGIGWLQRSLGLTCDNLLSVEMVTADGRTVTASEQQNAELFWGLRGGGGNFGVVTSFTFRLHEVGPEVLCGLVVHRAADAVPVLGFLRDWATTAPDDVMVVAVHRTAPPAPWLAEELHGTPILALAVCHAGPLAQAEDDLVALRSFGSPVADVVTPRPYATFQAMFDASWDPGFRNYWKAEYLRDLGSDTIATFARYAVAHTSPLSDFKVAMMGGAVSRVPADATAVGHRGARWVLNINTRWEDPAEDQHHIAHTRALFDEVAASASAGGTYVNFMGEEGEARVRHAYEGETFARLQALKGRWDPDNIFHINQNILPVG